MKVLSKLAEIPKFFGLSDEFEEEEMEYNTSPVDNLEEDRSAPSSSFFRQPRNNMETAQQEPVRSHANTVNTRTANTRTSTATQSYPQREYTKRPMPESKVVSIEDSRHIDKPRKTFHAAGTSKQSVKKIAVLEPRTYNESKNIAQCIFRNEVVIVNFHLVEELQARRIVDFLTGVVYALDGDIQRIGDEMFLCTPPNTEIDSTVAKSILGSQFSEY